jgi:hypothetical protein
MRIIPNIILNPKFSSFKKTTDVEHTKGKWNLLEVHSGHCFEVQFELMD